MVWIDTLTMEKRWFTIGFAFTIYVLWQILPEFPFRLLPKINEMSKLNYYKIFIFPKIALRFRKIVKTYLDTQIQFYNE